jgi:FMN reductase
MSIRPVRIVGLGGTLRAGSTSELALRACLRAAERLGAQTQLFTGADLQLPLFDPSTGGIEQGASTLIAALRNADGVVIASPGYHGSLSGLVKNALDYTELMRNDPRPYLDGRAVGCIVTAYGWQAVGTTLTTMRSIVHALRAWPTPLGVGLNSSEKLFTELGEVVTPSLASSLSMLAEQIVTFAMRANAPASKLGATAAL